MRDSALKPMIMLTPWPFCPCVGNELMRDSALKPEGIPRWCWRSEVGNELMRDSALKPKGAERLRMERMRWK